jgi:16S rRNA (guanine527-N7)-methyltransferase
MAGNVVNLNRFRKEKQRAAKAKQAETNRIRHGRTQAEKDRERTERERAERAIAGKRLDRPLVHATAPATPSENGREPLSLPPVPGLEVPEGMGERLAAIGANVSAGCLVTVGHYLARLLAMNERMNLTSVTDTPSAWERHAFDALSLVPHLAAVPAGGRLVDVGSGGGIPGIVLAIARPDLQITLIEATQKKAHFLSAVNAELKLANVDVRAERAEKLAEGPLARQFDVVTARALARLASLIPLTAPFARADGRLLLIKGQRAGEELAEATAALAAHRMRHETTVATPTGRIVILSRMR